MTDIFIRDIPDDILAAIDVSAQRLGLSRAEFVRRQLILETRRLVGPVTAVDLLRLHDDLVDLRDDEIMSNAWR